MFSGPPRIVLETAPVSTRDGAVYHHHRLSAGSGGVVVIARSSGRILFLRISRPAAEDATFVELPRGWMDGADEQDGVVAALRELREETGFAGRNARVVGQYILDTGIYPQPVTVVACDIDEAVPGGVPDGEADGGWSWLPETDLDRLTVTGVLRDAHTLASLSIWRADRRESRAGRGRGPSVDSVDRSS
ncbi:NUDIX domain-containing protein [uncultured Microbacterium sp.]|uniref:NUDIX hydrolase n=1 Tax=uncultured Microbacterium sp. TaxID=191216 RepID=UPI00345705B2